MRAAFHLKTLAVAIATLSVASMTNAAGLDRSGQDITAFLQDGTYAKPSIPILTLMSVALIMLVLRLMMQAMFKVMHYR